MKFWEKAVLVVLVLAVLVGVADRGGAWLLARKLNSTLAQHHFVSAQTKVNDLPLLPVLWRRQLQDLQLQSAQWETAVKEQRIVVKQVKLDLQQIDLDGQWRPAQYGKVSGSGQISTEDLTKLVGQYYQGLQIRTRGEQLTASTTIYGVPLSLGLSVQAAGKSSAGFPQIVVKPDLSQVEQLLSEWPEIDRVPGVDQVKAQLKRGYTIVFEQAPKGIEIKQIKVKQGQVEVEFAGSKVLAKF